jgi:hypothetical protein
MIIIAVINSEIKRHVKKINFCFRSVKILSATYTPLKVLTDLLNLYPNPVNNLFLSENQISAQQITLQMR